MKKISITFTPTKEQYKMIHEYQQTIGVPVSVTMRKAIDYYFKHLLNAPNFSKDKNGVEK